DRLADLSRGQMAEIELRIVSVSGIKRWLRMAAEPLARAAIEPYCTLIGMAEDITSRKTLMEHMFNAIQNEQRRIGADLHDGLGQVLTGVSLLLRSCHSRAFRGESVAPEELDQLLELVTACIETTRSLAHGLAPGTKEIGGLLSALSALAQQSRR